MLVLYFWFFFIFCGLFFISRFYARFLINFSLLQSIGILLWIILLWFTKGSFITFTINFSYLPFDFFSSELSIDGLSIIFLLLTAFIFPFCILGIQTLPNKKSLLFLLFSIEFLLFLTFTTKNLVFFYIFFEAILIPMFYLILVWGSRSRKIKAAFYLFMYTALGSIFFFISFTLLYYEYMTVVLTKPFIFYLRLLQTSELIEFYQLDLFRQLIIWVGLFITFAIKIPIFPFHIWLPEAHVEAPTVGSVILASLLLKIGGYGIIKFLLVFEIATNYMQPLVYCMCLISVIYASFSALRQIDIKKIIAYSSIAHMNFAVLALLSLTVDGFYGAVLLMLGHGIVAGALFLLIGVLYERYHSRNLFYYGGLTLVMPLASSLFFFFIISNFSFPGTANFIAEILILKAIFQINFFVGLILLGSSLLTVGYSIFLFNRLFFGSLKYFSIEYFTDLTRLEFYSFLPLTLVNLLIGFYPNIFLDPVYLRFFF